jgi:uncharacterized membrane-anchored protein
MSLSDILIICVIGVPMYIGAFFAYRASGSSRNVFIQGFTLVTCCIIAIILYVIANKYVALKLFAWLGIGGIILLMAAVIGVFGVREKLKKRE